MMMMPTLSVSPRGQAAGERGAGDRVRAGGGETMIS
jgi:hypothetical protein